MKRMNDRWQWLAITVAIVLSVATLTGVLFSTLATDTATLGTSDYALGSIDAELNKIIDVNTALYTKEKHSVEGLTIEVDEETCNVYYQIVFYDKAGNVIAGDSSAEYAADFNGEIPHEAETFRLVIHPYEIDGEKVKISVFEIAKYAKQVKVTYNK